jgi:hypothetical protein
MRADGRCTKIPLVVCWGRAMEAEEPREEADVLGQAGEDGSLDQSRGNGDTENCLGYNWR